MVMQDRIVLRNEFNNETFIFPPATDPKVARFNVILEIGGSGGGNALVHIHPGASETFTVKSGRLAVVMRGTAHILEVGQSLSIPAGTPHYFKNACAEATEAAVEFHPGQQHLRFFRNFAMLTEKRTEWFSTKGEPHLLLIALVLNAYRGHLYLAGMPIFVQKMLFGALAPIARFRGYRLEMEPLGSETQS